MRSQWQKDFVIKVFPELIKWLGPGAVGGPRPCCNSCERCFLSYSHSARFLPRVPCQDCTPHQHILWSSELSPYTLQMYVKFHLDAFPFRRRIHTHTFFFSQAQVQLPWWRGVSSQRHNPRPHPRWGALGSTAWTMRYGCGTIFLGIRNVSATWDPVGWDTLTYTHLTGGCEGEMVDGRISATVISLRLVSREHRRERVRWTDGQIHSAPGIKPRWGGPHGTERNCSLARCKKHFYNPMIWDQ